MLNWLLVFVPIAIALEYLARPAASITWQWCAARLIDARQPLHAKEVKKSEALDLSVMRAVRRADRIADGLSGHVVDGFSVRRHPAPVVLRPLFRR